MTIPKSRPLTSSAESRYRPARSPTATPTITATRNAATVSSRSRRSVLPDHVRDRAVVDDRLAEVEAGDLAEVLAVLDDERPVVAGGLAALLELLRGQPAAERRADRSPGATRMRMKTIVSRISTIGRTSASRVSRYALSEVL